MKDFRKKIINQFKNLLQPDDAVHCVWEGGSAATGYLDEYSDLDLGIICDDDYVELLFAKIESFLEDNYGISRKFRTPEPAWHGHSQCYYLLENTPPMFYADILIEKLSAGNRFMEEDRHGKSIVWFDRKKLFDAAPTPEEEILRKGKRFYQMIYDSTWLLIRDVQKQILRKNIIDAFVIYNQLVNRMSYLWNLKYRPAKSDFGLRYTHRDFPQEAVEWLKQVLAIKDLQEMEAKLPIIEDKYQQLFAELNEKWGE